MTDAKRAATVRERWLISMQPPLANARGSLGVAQAVSAASLDFGFLCASLCIAIPKKFCFFQRFHAALVSWDTVDCCAAESAVITVRPWSVRR